MFIHGLPAVIVYLWPWLLEANCFQAPYNSLYNYSYQSHRKKKKKPDGEVPDTWVQHKLDCSGKEQGYNKWKLLSVLGPAGIQKVQDKSYFHPFFPSWGLWMHVEVIESLVGKQATVGVVTGQGHEKVTQAAMLYKQTQWNLFVWWGKTDALRQSSRKM